MSVFTILSPEYNEHPLAVALANLNQRCPMSVHHDSGINDDADADDTGNK